MLTIRVDNQSQVASPGGTLDKTARRVAETLASNPAVHEAATPLSGNPHAEIALTLCDGGLPRSGEPLALAPNEMARLLRLPPGTPPLQNVLVDVPGLAAVCWRNALESEEAYAAAHCYAAALMTGIARAAIAISISPATPVANPECLVGPPERETAFNMATQWSVGFQMPKALFEEIVSDLAAIAETN